MDDACEAPAGQRNGSYAREGSGDQDHAAWARVQEGTFERESAVPDHEASQTVSCCAVMGRLMKYPCASSQPMRDSCSRVSWSSTPSATTPRPRFEARSIVERTIARSPS